MLCLLFTAITKHFEPLGLYCLQLDLNIRDAWFFLVFPIASSIALGAFKTYNIWRGSQHIQCPSSLLSLAPWITSVFENTMRPAADLSYPSDGPVWICLCHVGQPLVALERDAAWVLGESSTPESQCLWVLWFHSVWKVLLWHTCKVSFLISFPL